MLASPNKVLILADIRSAQNVGAIFRTADAVGITLLYLVGITPAPLDRFGRVRPDIAKSALGAEQTLSWKQVKTVLPLIRRLKKEGYQIVAIEQSPQSVDYKKVRVGRKVAFIVGNEVAGISPKVLAECDAIAEIPLRGTKESLNVSVATGIALFRMLGV